jgi:hypothetical protein
LGNGVEAYKMAKGYSLERENKCEDYGKVEAGFAGSDKNDIFMAYCPYFKNYQSFSQLI